MGSFFFFRWPPESGVEVTELSTNKQHTFSLTQFTTVQGKRPREIIISGKKAKKSVMGRRVPK